MKSVGAVLLLVLLLVFLGSLLLGAYSAKPSDVEISVFFGVAVWGLVVSVRAWTLGRLLCSVIAGSILVALLGPTNGVWGAQINGILVCTIGAMFWMSLYALHDALVSPQVSASVYLGEMLASRYARYLWVTAESDIDRLDPEARRAPYATGFRVLAGILASALVLLALKPGETAHRPEKLPGEAAEAPQTQGPSGIFPENSGAERLYRAAGKIVHVVDLAVLAFLAIMLFHPLSHGVEHLEERFGFTLGPSRSAVLGAVLLFLFVMGEHFLVRRFEEAMERHRAEVVTLILTGAVGPAVATYYWMRAMQVHPRAMAVAPLASSVSMAALLMAPMSASVAVALTTLTMGFLHHLSFYGLLLLIICFFFGGILFVFLFFFAVTGFLIAGPYSLAYAFTTRFAWRLPVAILLLVPVLVVTVPWTALLLALVSSGMGGLSEFSLPEILELEIFTAAGWYVGMVIDPKLHDCIRTYVRSKKPDPA